MAASPPRRPRRLLAAAAVAAVLALAATAVAGAALRDPPSGRASAADALIVPTRSSGADSPGRFLGGDEPLADNADPKKTGCADDPAAITTLDRVQVNTLGENLLGDLVLRHAPACHASWGRFEPSERLTYLRAPATVTITAHRPATGTVGTPFTVEFDGQAVFGNILLDDAGCVEVSVRVTSAGGDGSATTHCRR